MRLHERRHEDGDPAGNPPNGSEGGTNLGGLRQAGEDFLAAGDAAIDRALSGNSEKFNQATRQEGGQ